MDLAMLGGKPKGVPLNETFLPQVLKREGYHTHAVGKWHLGAHAWEFTPTFRGYDTYLGYLQGGESYFTHEVPWFIPGWLDKTPFPMINQYDFRRQSRPNCGKHCSTVELGAYNHYSTHLLTAEAERIIGAHNASEPLFMYLAYQAVHGPTEAPDSYVAPYLHIKDRRRQVYAGMVAVLDEGVNNVTRALKANGLWNNTLVVFTTDNGGPTDTCDPQGSTNGPLRGGKCSIYEGGTRGTAFVSGGILPGDVVGRPYSNMMHAVDLLPTFASFAGKDKPRTNFPLDGASHHNELLSVTSEEVRENVFYGFGESSRKGSAVRKGKWKLLRGPPALTGVTALAGKLLGPIINDIKTENHTRRLGEAHLIQDASGFLESMEDLSDFPWLWNNDAKEHLFDVSKDIGEHHDLAKQYPLIVKELAAILDYYKAQVPPDGTDPSLSPQCVHQKPTDKHWNADGPGGMPAETPYCDLYKTSEVLV